LKGETRRNGIEVEETRKERKKRRRRGGNCIVGEQGWTKGKSPKIKN
jgi:hypothetical protein